MLTKEPTYRDALSHSWQLVRAHKLLWVYGLFAAFLGQAGLLELATKIGFASTDYALYPTWLALPALFRTGGILSLGFTVEGWSWFGFVLAILLGFGLLLVAAAVISQGALISSVARSVQRRTFPHVGKAWHTGAEHFWRLFFINVCKKVSLVLLTVMTGWATLNVAVENLTSVGDVIIFFVVFVLAVTVGMVVSFIAVYAAGYVVVEEMPLFVAIESAWRLFVSHWLVSIEVGLVMLLLNVAVGIVSLIGLFVLFLPTMVLWFIAVLTGSYALINIAFMLGVGLFTIFVVLLGGVFTAYTTTTWTYLFMKMHKHGMMSRIMRLLS